MPNIRSMGHSVRSMYFVDYLRDRTGLGETTIERTIREQWYQPKGFRAPSQETVAAYFKGTRPISYDPSRTNVQSWLIAADEQFPGCAQAFLHPLWTFLFGEIHSNAKFIRQISIIPQRWIDECHANGDEDTAKEWQSKNEALIGTVPKKPLPQQENDLRSARIVMMSLPEHLRDQLLAPSGRTTFHRNFRPIEDEINSLQKESTLDSLSAILMLVVEAREIGDRCRLKVAKAAAKEHMNLLATDKAFRRVGELVRRVILFRCINSDVVTVSESDCHGWFPESWRRYECMKQLNEKMDQLRRRFANRPQS